MDQADEDIGLLARMQVLHLDQTERAKRLTWCWRYYEQRQHDEAEHEFDGRPRQRGLTYYAARQQALGYQTLPAATSVPLSARRPSCPTPIGGTIVDTYTSMLLGDGRQPSIKVSADPESTDLLAAMFAASNAWDALQEVRKHAGAEGAAALVVEVIDGVLSLRALMPEDLYIEWASEVTWTPRIAIEQKRVRVESIGEDGRVSERTVWRTRAWDQTHAYIYEDVDEDFGQAQASDGPAQRAAFDEWIELAEAPIEHQAGRCPMIWLQNTRCSDSPIGEPDYDGVYEQIDRLDFLWSMIMRGTCSNNDPTLVIKDKLIERRMWPMRAKGHGQKIELSEVGEASLLEMSGKTIETSMLVEGELKNWIAERTGVVPIRPDQAGAFQSGVALQILRGTLNERVGMRRPPLTRTIAQTCSVFLSLARAHGIKDVGAQGKGIELPPREVASKDPGEPPTFELPRAGKGNAVIVTWGALHSPTPTDLQVISQAVMVATGGKPVLSQETGVGMFGSLAQTETDPQTELARIAAEDQAKVAAFERSMTPDADEELDSLLEGEEQGGGENMDKAAGATTVQEQAMNGAQTKSFVDTLADVGIRLSPEAALFVITESFPAVDEAKAKAAIDKQMAFASSRPAQPDAPAPVPKPSMLDVEKSAGV